MDSSRIGWVDYGKGICIMLVVMMHSVHGYQDMVGATGWMDHVVNFAKPFRMPDFFLIAGLFLSRSIHGPLADYIDRKVIHFAYFYLLWLGLQTAAFEADLLLSGQVGEVATIFARQLIFPASSLWFIHQLFFFYIATRLLRHVPQWIVLAGAVGLHTALYAGWIAPGWSVAERFANWYVFFFTGYALAPIIFRFADAMRRDVLITLALLAAWAVWNGKFVEFGIAELPGVSLALGMAGAAAIIAVASLMSRFSLGQAVRYAGKHSIVIYLTFFLPMKAAQKGLSMTGLIPDVGTASLVVMLIGLSAPLAFHFMIKGTPLNFLYVRPKWLGISHRTGPASSRVAALRGAKRVS